PGKGGSRGRGEMRGGGSAERFRNGTGSREERLEVLRWMRRLGVQVDSSLLRETLEGPPGLGLGSASESGSQQRLGLGMGSGVGSSWVCHPRLSNGTLLSELAAALDHALSGGHSLKVRQVPCLPGSLTLKGTSYPRRQPRAGSGALGVPRVGLGLGL
ncbi:unnamed protein product, partial [Discosporangium mesarthrocarpum]